VTHLAPPGQAHPVAVPLAGLQGTLALDLDRLPSVPPIPELRVLPVAATPADPALRAWAARFAQATVEVLGGDRPVAQLLRWTTARVYADLDRRARVLGQVGPPAGRRRTVRPQVRSVHVFRPGPGCAEVSVHVRHGERSRALAARLEEREGRWRCVALELG
ncbi:MAG: Rv3235 family protein, partial [Nocardioidaceae bacterium]